MFHKNFSKFLLVCLVCLVSSFKADWHERANDKAAKTVADAMGGIWGVLYRSPVGKYMHFYGEFGAVVGGPRHFSKKKDSKSSSANKDLNSSAAAHYLADPQKKLDYSEAYKEDLKDPSQDTPFFKDNYDKISFMKASSLRFCYGVGFGAKWLNFGPIFELSLGLSGCSVSGGLQLQSVFNQILFRTSAQISLYLIWEQLVPREKVGLWVAPFAAQVGYVFNNNFYIALGAHYYLKTPWGEHQKISSKNSFAVSLSAGYILDPNDRFYSLEAETRAKKFAELESEQEFEARRSVNKQKQEMARRRARADKFGALEAEEEYKRKRKFAAIEDEEDDEKEEDEDELMLRKKAVAKKKNPKTSN